MTKIGTFSAAINEAASALKAAGIANPRREARLLLGLATGLDGPSLIAHEADVLQDDNIQDRFDALLARRCAREPFAHIAGRQEFYGLDFKSDARALIPRADSECLIDIVLALWPANRPGILADLGTGSGCLLGAILAQRPLLHGVGVEVDRAAATLARENMRKLCLAGRAHIIESAWRDWIGWNEVDVILANPPYIRSGEINNLAPEVRCFDPLIALDGGGDGLAAYRELTSLAGVQLRSGSHIIFEIGHDQASEVTSLLNCNGFHSVGCEQDFGSRDRVVFATKI